MYIRDSFLDKLKPPILDLHSAKILSSTEVDIRKDARRFESWEQYIAGKLALKKAIDYAMSWGLTGIQDRIFDLAAKLRQSLSTIDKVRVLDEGLEKCGIVTFVVDGISPQFIKRAMLQKNINLSVSSPLSCPMYYETKGLTDTIRASLHYFNTEQEIDIFIEVLKTTI